MGYHMPALYRARRNGPSVVTAEEVPQVTWTVEQSPGRVGLLLGPDSPDLGHLTPWDAASIARALMDAARQAGTWRACESCKAPVVWARTEAGQRMILDIGDHPGGNMAAKVEEGQLRVRACKPADPLHEGERRVMPHWATCPKADQHRRRGK